MVFFIPLMDVMRMRKQTGRGRSGTLWITAWNTPSDSWKTSISFRNEGHLNSWTCQDKNRNPKFRPSPVQTVQYVLLLLSAVGLVVWRQQIEVSYKWVVRSVVERSLIWKVPSTKMINFQFIPNELRWGFFWQGLGSVKETTDRMFLPSCPYIINLWLRPALAHANSLLIFNQSSLSHVSMDVV